MRVKLLKYFFESVRIEFPKFPGTDGKVAMRRTLWEYTMFANASRKNLFAYKLNVTLLTDKKGEKDFKVSFALTGIFDVEGGMSTKSRVIEFTRNIAPNMLRDILKSNLDGILSHALFKKRIQIPSPTPKDVKKAKKKK